mgnify:FL=1
MDSTDAPQIIEHINKSVSFTPSETKWIPFSARFLAAGITPKAKGALTVYEMNGGDAMPIHELIKDNGIKCGTFGACPSLEDRKFAVGDYAGVLSINDLEEGGTKPIFNVQAHAGIVNCIDGIGGATR